MKNIEFHIGGRMSGKTDSMLEWLTEAPEGEHRVIVSVSSARAMRLLSEARARELEVESWQFVGIDEVKHRTWSGVIAGRGGHIVLGLDDLDMMLYQLFGWTVGRVSATGDLVHGRRSPTKLATATILNGGVAKCDDCGEILLEDERHWHEVGTNG